MLGFSVFQEIYAGLKRNKLRTILTGLSISWGIFILIVLLGAGNGLQNGVMSNFEDQSQNKIQLYAGYRGMPHEGKKMWQWLPFKSKQIEEIQLFFPEVNHITAVVQIYPSVSYQTRSGSYTLYGVSPDYTNIFKLETDTKRGRFINYIDIQENRKVIVIDKRVEEVLFKEESAIGKYVQVYGIPFQVVGVNTKSSSYGETQEVYIPFSTAQILFNPQRSFHSIVFTVDGMETKEANDFFEERLRTLLSKSLEFSPKDYGALYIRNSQQDYLQAIKIFGWIDLLVSLIGVLTLVAGVVGVGNIMLVSVKERTREIGIRKAIGASPGSIMKSVIIESILLTVVFGYLGMIAGIGLLELIQLLLGNALLADQIKIFKDPSVKMSYILFATGVLVLAGVIAGYIPAKKAVKLRPVEAMKEK